MSVKICTLKGYDNNNLTVQPFQGRWAVLSFFPGLRDDAPQPWALSCNRFAVMNWVSNNAKSATSKLTLRDTIHPAHGLCSSKPIVILGAELAQIILLCVLELVEKRLIIVVETHRFAFRRTIITNTFLLHENRD